MNRKMLLGIASLTALAGGGLIMWMFMGGGSQQTATPPQPASSLPSPIKKSEKPKPEVSGNVQEQAVSVGESKDLTTGLPASIARLDYEIARLEREKKIEELKRDIEKTKREAKERNRMQSAVPPTPPPAPPPPPVNLAFQGPPEGATPARVNRPDWHVIGVACNERCYATIRLSSGEVISVREGSTMPDGSTVVRIDESGIVEFSNNMRRPVNMSFAERERRNEAGRTSKTKQDTGASMPVVLPPPQSPLAPRVLENYIQPR